MEIELRAVREVAQGQESTIGTLSDSLSTTQAQVSRGTVEWDGASTYNSNYRLVFYSAYLCAILRCQICKE